MRNTSAISSVIVRSWSNQAARAVGGRSVLALLCGLLALVAVVFGYFATREFIYPTFSSFSANESAVAILMGLLLTNVSVAVSMLLSGFLILSPSQTALDNLLSTMPVRPNQRVMGYYLPLVIVTVLTTTVLFSPVFVSLLYDANLSLFGALWVAFGLASHLLYVVVLNLAVYLISLTLLTRTLAADQSFSRLTATLVMSASSLATFAIALWRTDFFRAVAPTHHLNVHVVMLRGVIEDGVRPPLFYPAAAVCAVAVVLLLWVLLNRISLLSAPLERPAKPRWLESLPFGRHGLSVYGSQEIKQAVRHPENYLFAAFFVLLSSGLVLSSSLAGFDLDRHVPEVPLIIWFSCSLFAHNSYGRTLPAHWLVQVAPRRRSVWLVAKLAANCVYCGALAALLFVVYSFASDQTTAASFLRSLPFGLLLVLGLTLAGVVLPYSERYPFSSAFSALFGAILGLPLSYVLGRLLSIVPGELAGAAVLTLAAVVVLLIYCADRWKTIVDGSGG
ncbi:MAG TPA: hypothetical protein VK869_10840 [Rubrobacteraceae bacterium]|nr:hypothetical protein [Rubrobacteraceae bacterium]